MFFLEPGSAGAGPRHSRRGLAPLACARALLAQGRPEIPRFVPRDAYAGPDPFLLSLDGTHHLFGHAPRQLLAGRATCRARSLGRHRLVANAHQDKLEGRLVFTHSRPPHVEQAAGLRWLFARKNAAVAVEAVHRFAIEHEPKLGRHVGHGSETGRFDHLPVILLDAQQSRAEQHHPGRREGTWDVVAGLGFGARLPFMASLPARLARCRARDAAALQLT